MDCYNDIARTRERYHVSIRRQIDEASVLKTRAQMISTLTHYNINEMIDKFPSSISELQEYIDHSDQQDTIRKILLDSFQQLYVKVDMGDIQMYRGWSKLLKYILVFKSKVQDIFFNEFFEQYLEQSVSFGEEGTLFKLLKVLDLSKLPPSNYDALVQVVQVTLKNSFLKQDVEENPLTPTTKLEAVNFLLNLSSQKNKKFGNELNYVFDKVFCKETIDILKSIILAGGRAKLARASALNIFVNMFATQPLQQFYYQYFFEDKMFHNLRCIVEFGSDQEKVSCWKLLFNIQFQKQYEILKHNYHGIAAELIIKNYQFKEILIEVYSFFASYIYSLQTENDFEEFFQIDGIKAISCILNRYQLLQPSSLIQLLQSLKRMVMFSGRDRKVSISPVIVTMNIYQISSKLKCIMNEATIQASEIAHDLVELMDNGEDIEEY